MVAKKSVKKSSGKTRPAKKPAAGKASTTAGGFVFANPKPSPDDYGNFSQADVFADSNVTASTALQPIPKSWRQPEVLDLAQVLTPAGIQQIQAAKSIVFHAVGDSGGIKEPSKQFAVADAMAADLQGKTYQNGLPAFFFHLGDVVYYLGQERYYYDQFYDPYRDYDAPIFSIPGNHDGVVSPSLPEKSLDGFYANFCTQAPGHNPEAQGFARTTMTQPGVYFTLKCAPGKVHRTVLERQRGRHRRSDFRRGRGHGAINLPAATGEGRGAGKSSRRPARPDYRGSSSPVHWQPGPRSEPGHVDPD
jgi:hypothetical protein